MSAGDVAVGLTGNLAWPAVALALGLVFRKLITEYLEEIEVRGAKLRFGRALARAEASVAREPAAGEAVTLDDEAVVTVSSEVSAGLEKDPAGAISRVYEAIAVDLRERLSAERVSVPDSADAVQLALLARDRGLLTEQSLTSVREAARLRNLALHGTARATAEDASNYLTLVDEVLYSFGRRPTRSTARYEVHDEGIVIASGLPASAAFRLIVSEVARVLGEQAVLEKLGPPVLAGNKEQVKRPVVARRVAPDLDLWHTSQLNQADFEQYAHAVSELLKDRELSMTRETQST